MLYPLELEASRNWNLFLSPTKAGRFASRQKELPKIIQNHTSLVVAPTCLSNILSALYTRATQQHTAILHECLLRPPGAASPSAAWPTLCALANADAQLLGILETLWRPTTTFLHLLALFRLKGPNERPGFKDACSDPGTETHIASWSRLTKVLGCTVKEPVLLHWESKPKKQSCKGLPLSQKFQLITGCPTKLGLQTPWVLLGGSRNLGDSSATLSLGKEVPWRCLSVLLLCHVSKPELRPSWCAPWSPKSKNWQNTYGANYAVRWGGSQCTAKLHNHMLCPWTLWLLMSEKQLFECDIFFPKGTGSPCTKGDMGPGFSTRKGKHVHGQATSMQQMIRGNKIRAYK